MKSKTRILNILFSVATFIILLVLFTNLLCVLGWIVKIPITTFHLPAAFILTSYENYLLNKRYSKISKKDYIFTILSVILIFVTAAIIARLYWDISYDGGWYHSIAIIRLSDGWNPIYEYIKSGQFGDVFIDSYSNKSFWSFAATVYSLFKDINVAKVLSTLLGFAVSCLGISIFGQFAKNKRSLFMISILSCLIGFNPIYVSQVFSNYLDASLGLYSVFYVLLFISYYLEQKDFDNPLFNILIISCIALMTNTKLTGLFLAAVFFALFVIPKLIDNIIKKKFEIRWFKNMFLTGFTGVLLSVLLGLNPFVTNIVRGHNIFYPILGAEKIEVMGDNVPEAIRNKSNMDKIVTVNLSKTTNSVNIFNTIYNNPFLVDISDYKNISFDTRVGSFGNLFTTIIYLSIIYTLVFAKEMFKNNKKDKNIRNAVFLAILYIIITALLFSESWWGRYYPILYFIPILLAIYLILCNKKSMQYFAILLTAILVTNIGLITKSVITKEKQEALPIMKFVKNNQRKSVVFWCFDPVKKFDFAYLRYFKQNHIIATSSEEVISNPDFEGSNIQIKIIK